MKMKICVYCKKEFEPTGRQKYCSVCRLIAIKKSKKKYYQNNKEYYKKSNKKYYQNNKEYYKEYYQNNKEYYKKSNKKYYKNNKEHYKKSKKKYYQNNKEYYKKSNKKYYKNNKEHIKKYHKKYYKNNKEHIKKYHKKYRQDNKEYFKKYYKKYKNNRRATDVNFRITTNLRNRLYCAIKNNQKAGHTIELLGCSIDQFKIYMQNMFEPGMTWENYGAVWHIDHIIPCSFFNMSYPEHQIACFNWQNLQPMFGEENLHKSDNMDYIEIKEK